MAGAMTSIWKSSKQQNAEEEVIIPISLLFKSASVNVTDIITSVKYKKKYLLIIP